MIEVRRAHASAPVRIDFAGGWTDVPPFSSREGGEVVGASISLRVHVNVLPGGDSVHLISEDLGAEVELRADGSRAGEVPLPLLEASVRVMPAGNCTIISRCDAPNGSGLGTSGALGVALVAALAHARGESPGATDAAERAWRLESVDAGHPGGRQDQYLAALGGFQALSFRESSTEAEPLALDTAFAEELERSIVLCFTGVSRVSGNTIARVMAAYESGDERVTRALRGLRDAARAMRDALRAADLSRIAQVLDENWRHQQALDAAMCTPTMAALESAARAAGAVGGKAAGAGAGGSMFFLAPGRSEEVATAARAAGATVLPLSWSWEGVQRW